MTRNKENGLVARIVAAVVRETFGVEGVVKGLSDNERFSCVDPKFLKKIKHKIKVMPWHSSYSQDLGTKARVIDLLGPCDDVPDYAVASSGDEKSRIQNNKYGGNFDQNQLIVLPTGIYLRHLNMTSGCLGYGYMYNLESIHFSRGYCLLVDRSIESHKEGHFITTKQIWETAVESMMQQFLDPKIEWSSEYIEMGHNDKILFGSEKCRDKVIETLGKCGLKKIE